LPQLPALIVPQSGFFRILEAVGGKLPVQSNRRIPVKAGKVIGKVGGRSLDFAITDDHATPKGLVNRKSYEAESWKIHTVDPLIYFDAPIKSQILSKNLRPVEPRGGKSISISTAILWAIVADFRRQESGFWLNE
jgi:hypothetical protein